MLIIWPSLGGKDKGWERTRMSTEWKTNHAVIWPPHTSSVRNKSSQQLFLLNGPVWHRSMCESKPKSCLYEQPPISPFVSVTQWFCRQSFRGIWALRCWVKVWKRFPTDSEKTSDQEEGEIEPGSLLRGFCALFFLVISCCGPPSAEPHEEERA